jgi:hypothetical protein
VVKFWQKRARNYANPFMRENTRGYRRKTVNLHVELVSDAMAIALSTLYSGARKIGLVVEWKIRPVYFTRWERGGVSLPGLQRSPKSTPAQSKKPVRGAAVVSSKVGPCKRKLLQRPFIKTWSSPRWTTRLRSWDIF